jgi:hypothetical protein
MADVFVGDKALVTPAAADSVLLVQGGLVKRSLVSSIGGTIGKAVLNVMDYIPRTEWAAIEAYTSTYDCQSAFTSARAAAAGKRLRIPDGGYRLASSWVIDRSGNVDGDIIGDSVWGTRLLPDNGVTAIRMTSAQQYNSTNLSRFWIRHALDHTSGGGIHCVAGVQVHDCKWDNLQIDSHGIPVFVGNHFSHKLERITARSLTDAFVLRGGNTILLDNCYGAYWSEDGGTVVSGSAAYYLGGGAAMTGCNGTDGHDYWAIIGSLADDKYFGTVVYPFLSIDGNSNLEGWKKAGIKGQTPGIVLVRHASFQYTHASTAFDAYIQLAGADSTLIEGCKFNTAGGAQTYGGSSSVVASTGTPNLVMINQGGLYQYFNTSNSTLYPVTAISPTISRQDTSIVNIKANLGTSGNEIPTPAVGDVAWGVEVYSAPRGVGSGPMAYENAKWHSMVRDKLTLDYQLSANTTIDARYLDGRRITNGGASGTITATLPTATVGDYCFFCRNIAQTFRVDPNGSEIIGTGGAGKYLELGSLGAAVELRCVYAGVWMVTGQQGTVTYEP